MRQDNGQAITWIGNPESRFTFDLVADENVTQVLPFVSAVLYAFFLKLKTVSENLFAFICSYRSRCLKWLECLWWRMSWLVTIAVCLLMARWGLFVLWLWVLSVFTPSVSSLMIVLICRLEVGKLTLCLEISREEHVDIVSTAGWHLEFLSICSQGSKRFGALDLSGCICFSCEMVCSNLSVFSVPGKRSSQRGKATLYL